jgi:hypothetical protein
VRSAKIEINAPTSCYLAEIPVPLSLSFARIFYNLQDRIRLLIRSFVSIMRLMTNKVVIESCYVNDCLIEFANHEIRVANHEELDGPAVNAFRRVIAEVKQRCSLDG